jgi:uncharacterized protein (TIGR03435 family)
MNAVFPALVNGAILSALLTAAVWLALRLVPRRVLNAATRYAVWWAALAVVVAMPALFLRPSPAAPPPLGTPISGLATPTYLAAPPPPGNANLRIGVFRSFAWPQFPIEISAGKWPRWVMGFWLIVGAIMLIRLTASWIVLQRYRARASDPPEALRTRAAHWLALCGSKRRNVRVVCSTEIAIPAAVGPLRPAIVIPARLLGELEEDALDQIGMHEAAHLARRDDYALAVQRVIEALFALHPVVRWIARRIDLEREIACDDFVLAAKGESKSYAWCLTRMAELTAGASPSPAAAAATSNLARRVDLLLDKTRHTGTRLLRARLAVVIAALGALAWAVGRSPDLLAFVTPPVQTAPQTPPSPILLPMPARAAESPQRPASDKPPAPTAPPEIAATVALQTESAGQAVVAPPSFEVASIKPAAPQQGNSMLSSMRQEGGQIRYTNVHLKNVLARAYGVRIYQIAGPAWLDSERYDIVAKAPHGVSEDRIPAMVQALLADRFQMTVRREAREQTVYALGVGKGGPRLTKAGAGGDAPPPPPGSPGGVMTARKAAPNGTLLGAGSSPTAAVTMMMNGGSVQITANAITLSRLAEMLSNMMSRLILDTTGIQGNYDVTLDAAPDEFGIAIPGDAPQASEPATSIFTSIQRLGLKLEPRKAPVEFIVVDKAEKVPTEN